MQIVFSVSCAHKTNFRYIRPSATIGATGHTDNNFFIPQLIFCQQWFNFRNQRRQISLCLRQVPAGQVLNATQAIEFFRITEASQYVNNFESVQVFSVYLLYLLVLYHLV